MPHGDASDQARDDEARRPAEGHSKAQPEGAFRRLIEHLPMVAFEERVNPDNPLKDEIVYISPRVEELSGYTQEEYAAPGFFWDRVVYPDDREKVIAEVERSTKEGDAFRAEFRVFAKSGRLQWVYEVSELFAVDPDGTQTWIGVSMDITERKETELALEETIHDLREVDAARRSLLRDLVRAQEEERSRIATDLHDDIVQAMTALAIQVEISGKRVRAGDAVEEDFSEIADGIRQAMGRMRRMMFELRPRSLDEDGLAAAIAVLLRQFRDDTGAATELHNELSEEPDRDLRGLAFRLARECLINVRKHARATSVQVTIWGGAAGIGVKVRDDGGGFDPAAGMTPMPGHLGLDSMRERAVGAGGRFEVRSAPGEGSEIEFWLPSLDA